MRFRDVFLRENGVACNSTGAGAVAGIGVGPEGTPPVNKRKKKPILRGPARADKR
jgi:hypothetical protein